MEGFRQRWSLHGRLEDTKYFLFLQFSDFSLKRSLIINNLNCCSVVTPFWNNLYSLFDLLFVERDWKRWTREWQKERLKIQNKSFKEMLLLRRNGSSFRKLSPTFSRQVLWMAINFAHDQNFIVSQFSRADYGG